MEPFKPEWIKLLAGWGVTFDTIYPNLPPYSRVLINERDPRILLSALFSCLSKGCSVFLANPDWGHNAWQQAMALASPELIIGEIPTGYSAGRSPSTAFLEIADSIPRTGGIFIPTGGTGGRIRFALHSDATLTSSARGLISQLGEYPHSTCVVLPLFHVGGLMSVWRALVSGGDLQFVDWKQLMNPAYTATRNFHGWNISLVPTQLKRLLESPEVNVLKDFECVFLGGGSCPIEVQNAARARSIRVAPCYGMTETAAMVTLLKPSDFLDGAEGVGTPLPHAQIFIREPGGLPAGQLRDGQIVVRADSLCHALLPGGAISPHDGYATGDMGHFDQFNRLHITGRGDAIIITGGEKVDPFQVERCVMQTGMTDDAIVVGIPNDDWGQAVTLLYVSAQSETTPQKLRQAIQTQLSKYEIPKYYLRVDSIPRNALGKTDRAQLIALATADARPID